MSALVLPIAALEAPALLLAGLASGLHCALMCGPLHAHRASSRRAWMHVGRLAAYTLIGALAGGAGAMLLRASSLLPMAQWLRLAALPLLAALILCRSARVARPTCCAPAATIQNGRRARRHALGGFGTGLVTGLTPCGLLYAAAAYAALAGSAGAGALLLLAFGIGTVPWVQAGAWGWSRALGGATMLSARRGLLVAIGVLMLLTSLYAAPATWLFCTP